MPSLRRSFDLFAFLKMGEIGRFWKDVLLVGTEDAVQQFEKYWR